MCEHSEHDQTQQDGNADNECDQIRICFAEKYFHHGVRDIAPIQGINGKQIKYNQNQVDKRERKRQVDNYLRP